MVWKAKAVCPNEGKENNHRQTQQHPNLQALTNTRRLRGECVSVWVCMCGCPCLSKCGCSITGTDLSQVSINHIRPATWTQQSSESTIHWEMTVYINNTSINYELLPSHLHAHTHTNTGRHTHTHTHAHCAACKKPWTPATTKSYLLLNTTKIQTDTPHTGHKTHTNPLNGYYTALHHLIKRSLTFYNILPPGWTICTTKQSY